MQIQINKDFVKYFIDPISDLHKEGKVSIFSKEDYIYSLSSTKSNSITLFNTYIPVAIQDPIDRISININKLVKGLQCVYAENAFVNLSISEETAICSFQTEEIKFNIRLLDNNLVYVPKFNLDNFLKFKMDHTVDISVDKVLNIKKALEFSTEAVKFYVEQEGDVVYFYFGDKTTTSNHLDDVRVMVASGVKSGIPNKIYDIDLLRLILKHKNDFSMKFNDNGVVYIEIELPNSNLKYITTPIIK